MKLRATLCFVLVMLVGVMLGHAGLTIGGLFTMIHCAT
jgi:hypothetical protein